jgi:ankyrin repeat protein
MLLDTQKVDVDAKDVYGQTPLVQAAANRHDTVVKMLLDTQKVGVNAKDDDGRTPLVQAAANEYNAVVKMLAGRAKGRRRRKTQ